MSESWLYTLILGGSFLALFGLAELLYHYARVPVEMSRKFVHFGSGAMTLLFPVLVKDTWLVLLLCSSFLMLLFVSLQWDFLKSINKVDRKTYGSLLFPVVVFGSYLAFEHFGSLVYYHVPILVLAVSDPAAALVGKGKPMGKYTVFGHSKTLSGSTAFLITAAGLTLSILLLTDWSMTSGVLVCSLLVGLGTTLVEAVSHKGWDNFTIPAAAICVLALSEQWQWI